MMAIGYDWLGTLRHKLQLVLGNQIVTIKRATSVWFLAQARPVLVESTS